MDLQNDDGLAADEIPDFSTLSEIMDYFHKVPFDTFRKTLDDWFLNELPNRRPDLIKQNGEVALPLGLFDLIEKIFERAEKKAQSRLN